MQPIFRDVIRSGNLEKIGNFDFLQDREKVGNLAKKCQKHVKGLDNGLVR